MKTRKIGIEIEVPVEFTTLKSFLKDNLSTEILNHFYMKNKWFKSKSSIKFILKVDSSCGSEITTPPMNLNSDEIKITKEILKTLKLKYQTHYTCGTHIHFDVSDLIENSILFWFLMYEPIFCLITKKDRQRVESEYNETEEIFTERYSKDYFQNISEKIINCFSKRLYHHTLFSMRNFQINGTVENRGLESTFDWKDIENWILLNLYFLEHVKTKSSIDDILFSMCAYNNPLIESNDNIYRKCFFGYDSLEDFLSKHWKIKTKSLIKWCVNRAEQNQELLNKLFPKP